MKKIIWTIFAGVLMTMPAYALSIKSSDFMDGKPIPRDYTCMGRNQSPALSWGGEPGGTVSFALICEDPDAPMGTWTHWVIFNLPASLHELSGGLEAEGAVAGSGQQGVNDFQKNGYGGPCPPMGQTHRYQFKLYALDTMLSLTGSVTRSKLLAAMEGHIMAEAQVMGTFRR